MTRQEVDQFDTKPGPVPQVYIEKLYTDDRGHFAEVINRERTSVPEQIAQINHSHSKQNVLRGMHWQVPPFAAGKYVTCLQGAIDDVVVDIRRSSTTFGHNKSYYLLGCDSIRTRHSLWVPPGFAHGFLVMSEEAEVVYLQDGLYRPEAERSFRYDDPDVGISWTFAKGERPFILSEKDAQAPYLKDLCDDDLFA